MTATSRILLMPDARTATSAHAPKVRRYRLARVRLAERREQLAAGHAHLLRAHD